MDLVLTMMFNETATEEVMRTALPAFKPGAVWIQSATVGLEGARRLAAQAEAAGVTLVDAPVRGTRQPAADGTLTVLAGGPPEVRDAVAPVFDAVGSRTVWVGEKPGDGDGTDSPYAHLKGKAMIAGEFPPAFPVAGAAKDTRLIEEAMGPAGVDPSLVEAFRRPAQ